MTGDRRRLTLEKAKVQKVMHESMAAFFLGEGNANKQLESRYRKMVQITPGTSPHKPNRLTNESCLPDPDSSGSASAFSQGLGRPSAGWVFPGQRFTGMPQINRPNLTAACRVVGERSHQLGPAETKRSYRKKKALREAARR